MHMPQLSRMDPYARVSPAARSDDAKAAGEAGAFTEQLRIAQDGQGRSQGRDGESGEQAGEIFAQVLAETLEDPLFEGEPAEEDDSEALLPEDAHDPQELCALLLATGGKGKTASAAGKGKFRTESRRAEEQTASQRGGHGAHVDEEAIGG